MKIDPAAEAGMVAAPVGSCPNDPTQDKCPPAKAFVRVDPDENGRYELVPPASASRRAHVAAHGRARIAAAPWCTFRFNGPYKAAGYAQGDASNECVTKVTRMEIYGTLLKLYNGTWYNMVTRSQAKDYVAGKVEVHPRWDCVANSPYRNWDFLADSYTLHVGVWYYAGNYNYNWLYCG